MVDINRMLLYNKSCVTAETIEKPSKYIHEVNGQGS
jgi:hypothetical protein